MVAAYNESRYCSRGDSLNPPQANARINTWSSKKSVRFIATRIPFASVSCLNPKRSNVRALTTLPGVGRDDSSISVSGISKTSAREISPRASSPRIVSHAAATSASVIVARPSIARITHDRSMRRRSANAFTSSSVTLSTHAFVSRASSSAPTTNSPRKKCPTSSSLRLVQYVWSRSTNSCSASAICFALAILSSCSPNPCTRTRASSRSPASRPSRALPSSHAI